MLSLVGRFAKSSQSRLTYAFPIHERHARLLGRSPYELYARHLSRLYATHIPDAFTLAESCVVDTAHKHNDVSKVRDSVMFIQLSAEMACHPQLWRCPCPTLGGLTLMRRVSCSDGIPTVLHGHGASFVVTAIGGRQFCSLCCPAMELEKPQPKRHSAFLKRKVYDRMVTERIAVELFPELSFPLVGNFYPKLVPLVAKKIKTYLEEEGGEERIPELLQLLGLKLTPHLVGEVLKLQMDTTKAHLFFEWARNLPGYKHTAHTYHLKFWSLISIKKDKPGNLLLAVAILEEMMAKNIAPGALACNILIDRLCKECKLVDALNIVRELERDDFPDVVTYNSLINGLGKAGRFREVFELIEKMKAKGLTPQRMTYNAIIHGLGTAGRWQEACQIFEELLDKGIIPDVVSYNSLIVGLFKCRQVDEAFKVYGLMSLRGCEPDQITYNTLIDGLAKADQLDEAWKIFDYMKQNGCMPDVITYNTLIGAMINNNNQMEALRLLVEMSQKGCKPSEVTYRLLSGMDPMKISSYISQVEHSNTSLTALMQDDKYSRPVGVL